MLHKKRFTLYKFCDKFIMLTCVAKNGRRDKNGSRECLCHQMIRKTPNIFLI